MDSNSIASRIFSCDLCRPSRVREAVRLPGRFLPVAHRPRALLPKPPGGPVLGTTVTQSPCPRDLPFQQGTDNSQRQIHTMLR